MGRDGSDKRSRLIATAADLSHRHGFGNTALADIAGEAGVPLGNVYYYFKTKAEIGEAIVDRRLAEFEMMRQQWERASTPKARLLAFVQITIENRRALARSGCPIGSFCSELHKTNNDLAKKANRPFAELLRWIEAQFGAMGKGRDKSMLALHLLSALQGVSLLANSFNNPDLVVRESGYLKKWIRSL